MRISAASLVVSSLALAACSGGDVVVQRSESPTAFSGDTYVQYSAAYGANAISIYNPPFAPEATVDAVLAAARERYASGQYRFFAGPPPEDWNGYTIRIAFGRILGNSNLCAKPEQPLFPAAAGRTELLAEYCYGGILVTEARGWAPALTGPDDPHLKQVVAGMVAELFAYRPRRGSKPPRN